MAAGMAGALKSVEDGPAAVEALRAAAQSGDGKKPGLLLIFSNWRFWRLTNEAAPDIVYPRLFKGSSGDGRFRLAGVTRARE